MIHIIDYGVGNIQAFINIFKRLGIEVRRTNSPCELIDTTHLILPGVGHFDRAMQLLNDSKMRPRLEDLVFGSKVPILGICVGLQMLGSGSDEGNLAGLNWIPGRSRSFASHLKSNHLPAPHMGWNQLQIATSSKLFTRGFIDIPEFYFLHSYYFEAEDKIDVAATSYYGFNFDAAISRGHIYGVQFHPEKSHHWGSILLKNFVEP